jgi:hypothetical protein
MLLTRLVEGSETVRVLRAQRALQGCMLLGTHSVCAVFAGFVFVFPAAFSLRWLASQDWPPIIFKVRRIMRPCMSAAAADVPSAPNARGKEGEGLRILVDSLLCATAVCCWL